MSRKYSKHDGKKKAAVRRQPSLVSPDDLLMIAKLLFAGMGFVQAMKDKAKGELYEKLRELSK